MKMPGDDKYFELRAIAYHTIDEWSSTSSWCAHST